MRALATALGRAEDAADLDNLTKAHQWWSQRGLPRDTLATASRETLPETLDGQDPRAAFVARLSAAARVEQSDPAGPLAHGEVTTVEDLEGGHTNDVFRLTVTDEEGNRHVGYYKPLAGLDDDTAAAYGQPPKMQALHEVAAWRLAQAIGAPWDQMVAPAALRDGPFGLGSISGHRTGGPVHPRAVEDGDLPDGQVRAMAVLDSMAGQMDRHPDNFYFDHASSRIGLFDHGYCFARAGDETNFSMAVEAMSDQDAQLLTPQEQKAVDRLARDEKSLSRVCELLDDDRAVALRRRVATMSAEKRILGIDEF